MSENTLYDKVFDSHVVGELKGGQKQIFVDTHPVHEVTSPQAFEMLRERGLKVRHPELTFATLDHVIPTDCRDRPYKDSQAELMAKALEDNVKEFGITYFGPKSGKQGVIHVTMPEQGVILPGQVVVCGDSHTCTYGALGALAFGIGTTQVSHVLATQTLAMDKLKVRRINLEGRIRNGTTAKDIALMLISQMGVEGGVGFVHEYGGKAIENMNMDGRFTLCNMSVEGGARSGYVLPDETTADFIGERLRPRILKELDRRYQGHGIMEIQEYFNSLGLFLKGNEVYDDIKTFDVSTLLPFVTWGTNPGQAIPINGKTPSVYTANEKKDEAVDNALEYMGLHRGQSISGLPVDVVFIGSCTNGRLSDLGQAASIMKGRKVKVKTLVVPGSEQVEYDAKQLGLDKIFIEAGAEWRSPGCSMCLAMNPDKLTGYERSASTSNRNFKGRQGSPTGRTHLMSPYTAAATALEGKISDPRRCL